MSSKLMISSLIALVLLVNLIESVPMRTKHSEAVSRHLFKRELKGVNIDPQLLYERSLVSADLYPEPSELEDGQDRQVRLRKRFKKLWRKHGGRIRDAATAFALKKGGAILFGR